MTLNSRCIWTPGACGSIRRFSKSLCLQDKQKSGSTSEKITQNNNSGTLTWSFQGILLCFGWPCLMGWCEVWSQVQNIQSNHCKEVLKQIKQKWKKRQYPGLKYSEATLCYQSFVKFPFPKCGGTVELLFLEMEVETLCTLFTHHLLCQNPVPLQFHKSSIWQHCELCSLLHPTPVMEGWTSWHSSHTEHVLQEHNRKKKTQEISVNSWRQK